jgi:hypothetical protein
VAVRYRSITLPGLIYTSVQTSNRTDFSNFPPPPSSKSLSLPRERLLVYAGQMIMVNWENGRKENNELEK